jgi:exopolysaccharide biosynthesis polyprenyl glycosylphosphotransferase
MNSNKKIHFEISERKILLKFFDVLSVLTTLYIVSYLFDFEYFTFSISNYNWIVILGVYVLFFATVFEMYNLQVASNQFQIVRSIVLTSTTTAFFYLLTPIYTPILPSSRLQIMLFFFSIFFSLLLWRIFYLHLLASHRFVKKAIIICDKEQLSELVTGLESVNPHYKFIGFVNPDLSNSINFDLPQMANIKIEQLTDFILKNSISEIVVASQKTDGITVNLYNQLIHLLENGITIKEYTQVYEAITQRIPVQYVARDFYRYFPFSRSNSNKLYLLITRALEIAFSLIGLLFGILLIPFILIGNLFGNKGKLLYKQDRVGKNGKVFEILKFRTMIADAESNGAVFASPKDIRINPFGKFLRKSRIDEFPQFINILKGDMGIIGPRPERPIFVEEIAEFMPFYETRHIIKPGLTGWAQVNYSYGDSISDSLVKLQYDLYYIKHRSIFLDINIIIKTFSAVLFYRGQ